MYELEVIKLDVEEAKKNPNNPYKWGRWTHTGCAQDYSISELEKYLIAKKMSASQLVWNALINAPKNFDIALFKPNQQYRQETVDSQLVYHLKNHDWIPNTSGEFCTPRAMIHEALRADFPFNDGNGLLTKIEFGKNAMDVKHSDDWLKQHQDRVGLERQQELKRNEEQKIQQLKN